MKNILFIVALYLVYSLTQYYSQRDTTKIVYKYIPRTFEQEQKVPNYPSVIYKDLFTELDPWWG
jgi:hypothetical protein